MTILQLQYFLELCKTLHYTKAAENLHISQPGLSYSITELEKELGGKLFNKAGRRFSLTPGGEAFRSYVEKALLTLQEGQDAFRSTEAGAVEQVDLGYLHSLGAGFIPAMIKAFYEEGVHKTVTFSFMQDTADNLAAALKNGAIDLAFLPESDAAFEAVQLMVQALYLAVPAGHPLAQQRGVTLKDFAGEKVIMMDKSAAIRRQIEKIYKEEGLVPRLSFELRECSTIQQYVTLGMGLAIVPLMPELRTGDIQLLPIADPRFSRPVYCAWQKKRPLSKAAASVRDFAVEHGSEGFGL